MLISPPTSYITSLSLHDALPISGTLLSAKSSVRRASEMSVGGLTMTVSRGLEEEIVRAEAIRPFRRPGRDKAHRPERSDGLRPRSEEHTSELQSLAYLVCRLLLE